MAMDKTTRGLDQVKTSKTVELLEANVLIATKFQNLGILHTALFKGSAIHFVLDDLMDLSTWHGFSSCLSDFKKRNVPMFSGRLLGSVPLGTMASYPNERYKILIRSLLKEMVGLHRNEHCFSNISESDICLRVRLLNFHGS
uniref:Uncharacterized protein n=1 Tax=Setaria viridis TaxID=4556 RepID=A0A4U6V8R4_SETVI|nr:hypothetical protein SEVIR_4G286700v2 [Setaria viridis]